MSPSTSQNKLDLLTANGLEDAVRKDPVQRNGNILGNALRIGTLMGLIAYIVFFLIKHRKTHGFKKLD
jgi:hypothetical protein